MAVDIENTINDTARVAAERAVAEVLRRGVPEPQYMDTSAACIYLGLSRQRLEIWRCRGGGPPYSKLSSAVRYARRDLDAFMASRRIASTSEVPGA